MATVVNPLDLIDSELHRAAQPRTTGNKKPIFLFLKEGHKATLRPLYDLSGCIVLSKHSKFDSDPERRVNAICANETGAECAHCATAKADKKLQANVFFYLPVYVYQVVDQNTGQKITYKERDDNGNEQEKPVQGIRVLELSSFGTIGAVLKAFREWMRDEDNCKMTDCDFTLSQVGQGQNKSFVLMPKAPKAMDDRLVRAIPSQEQVRARIIEALPPTLAGGAAPVQSSPMGGDDGIPEF